MSRRLPSLTALRAFDALARQKSFTAAAAELNVTKSAISHQIRQLEEELNCRLVQRGGGRISLSAEGVLLAGTVTRAFRRIGEVSQQISTKGDETLELQVYSTFAVRWLLPRLPGFETVSPAVDVRVITAQDDADLSSETMDACVLIGAPEDASVRYHYLFTSSVFPVCSPGYLEAHGAPQSPEDLAAHTLLQVYPSEDDWAVWLEGVGVDGATVSGTTRFDSYDHALNSAREGLGVALAIEPFAEADLATGRLVELFPGRRIELPRQWYFAHLKAKSRAPAILALAEWLKQQVADDPAISGSAVAPVAAVE